jgi:CSN8/PSMD8/EIF3K family
MTSNELREQTHLPLQDDAAFQASAHLLKLLWNREFVQAWPVLSAGAWPECLAPMTGHLKDALRQRVAAYIGNAYINISVDNAAAMLGMAKEELVAGVSWLPHAVVKRTMRQRPFCHAAKQQCMSGRLACHLDPFWC